MQRYEKNRCRVQGAGLIDNRPRTTDNGPQVHFSLILLSLFGRSGTIRPTIPPCCRRACSGVRFAPVLHFADAPFRTAFGALHIPNASKPYKDLLGIVKEYVRNTKEYVSNVKEIKSNVKENVSNNKEYKSNVKEVISIDKKYVRNVKES